MIGHAFWLPLSGVVSVMITVPPGPVRVQEVKPDVVQESVLHCPGAMIGGFTFKSMVVAALVFSVIVLLPDSPSLSKTMSCRV